MLHPIRMSNSSSLPVVRLRRKFASGLLLVLATLFAASGSLAQAPRVPVLVELFTSEGCSDCPAADSLLERLDKEQFVPGAEVIVLSEHVTYWNYLGWRDPFSMQVLDARQQVYGEHFGLGSIYTPQAVVDGGWQFVGSDERRMRAAVAEAAAAPKTPLALEEVHAGNGAVSFRVRGRIDLHARLFAALAADATHSDVVRGENAGRTLHHVAAVRGLHEFTGADVNGQTLSMASIESGATGSITGPLRLVVWVADARTGRVVSVAMQKLPR